MLPTLLTILLLEGFITISIEILFMRQLMPFFGGSVVITSIIIGVFLLFLSLGYWRGGYHRQNFLQRLSYNFMLSMLWVGIGLSYNFIAIFSFTTIVTLSWPFLLCLTLYLLCVLAPVIFWLGQTIPVTTNLFNQNKTISQISGGALFLSTLGSFLGAIVTSLILFQYLGVAWTIVANCALLFILVVWLQPDKKFKLLQLVFLGGALLFIKNINVDDEKKKFILTNNYANYEVLKLENQSRLLKINESYSSLIQTNKQGLPYIEYMRYLLFNQLDLKKRKLLIIGAGGFSLTAAGTNDNEVTYVDIDPAIKDLAENHFLKQPVKGKFVGQDARLFLNQNSLLYDVIISDVYSHEATIPPALLTVEYFQQIREHLNPSGLLMVNVIANPLYNDAFARRVANTLHEVFTYCVTIPVTLGTDLSNIIYVCPNVAGDKTIYTDDLSSATFDFFKSRQGFLKSQ